MIEAGVVKHVCTSDKKGIAKREVWSADLLENHGIVGDAHAGQWHRQISILDEADISSMRAHGLRLKPGAFGENFSIEGMDLAQLGIGTRLAIGAVQLEITQIGKVCHNRCAIYYIAGDCIMPRAGLFAAVSAGGVVKPGTVVSVATRVARSQVQAAMLTVSDQCAKGEVVDNSGPALSRFLGDQLNAHIAWTGMVPGESDEIERILKDLSGRGLDLILTTGGTGFTTREVTLEAARAVIDREAPGYAETMRTASMRTPPHTMLHRGVCGILGSTLIVHLPGRERDATENLRVMLPALSHAIGQLRGDGSSLRSE